MPILEGDASSSSHAVDQSAMDRILLGKHQGVRSFYALFQALKLCNVELSDTASNILEGILGAKDVREIRLPPVVNEFRKLKEILDSLQAAQDEASRDLYVLYFHPTAAGEALYKQLKSATALQLLDVGKDMMESKGAIQTFESAVKAVEKHKKENEQKTKKEKEQKDARASSGRGQQPSNSWKPHRGGGRGRGGGGRGDGWASAPPSHPSPHMGWHGGGGGYPFHPPGPYPYYNGGQFSSHSGRGGGSSGPRP